ncbi:MAG: prepilin-type N-terminal cleavage/methylation domain-containing protein [Desulfobacterota bacterium]|nr:prepilin-type N-terminal cleavage/methylation domain-containing protein [Thermodesulfobacteriota bacterium]
MHTNQSGFTLLEVTCAIVILTVGLMGVAAMQAKSIQGNAFSASYHQSAIIAHKWMEWIMDFVNRGDQENIMCSGKLNRANYCSVMSLDISDVDDQATEIEIPSTTAELLQFLNDNGFTNAEGTNLTAEQIPAVPGAGYRMVWRILANRPVQDTTTVEIQTTCSNAFSVNRSTRLRFIVSSAM